MEKKAVEKKKATPPPCFPFHPRPCPSVQAGLEKAQAAAAAAVVAGVAGVAVALQREIWNNNRDNDDDPRKRKAKERTKDETN